MISHTRDVKEWIRKHTKWPFYTFSPCSLHASNRMVKKGDRRKEAVRVPKLKPVKHLRQKTMCDTKPKLSHTPTPAAFFDDFTRGL